MKNISIRVRVLTLAAILISLTIGIAGIGWHALEQVAIAISISARENEQAQLFLQSEREISGGYSRVGAYMQTAADVDLQRFYTRKAAADAGLEKAANLSSDAADRQATMASRALVQEFLASGEAIIQKRKALGQRADSIRDALAALEMLMKRDDKASVTKSFFVANAGEEHPGGAVQANVMRRRPPMPAARPTFLSDRAVPENDAVVQTEITPPPEQSKVTAEPAADALFQRAGEAALLVTQSPSEATLAAHAKAMQAVENLTPPNAAAARLLVLARDAAAPAREVLENYTKAEATQRVIFEKFAGTQDPSGTAQPRGCAGSAADGFVRDHAAHRDWRDSSGPGRRAGMADFARDHRAAEGHDRRDRAPCGRRGWGQDSRAHEPERTWGDGASRRSVQTEFQRAG
jgi:CHASE3 domain sensor protein